MADMIQAPENPAQETTPVSSPNQKDIVRFTKKKSKKKIALALIVVIALVAVGIKMMLPKSTAIPVSISPLERSDLVNMINASGTLQSANEARVYAPLSGTVNTIRVQVGDTVKKGDLLAQFDTADLQLAIAKQQALMGNSAIQEDFTQSNAQKQLDQMMADLANNRYSPLVNAEQSVTLTAQRLADARREANLHDQDIDKSDEEVHMAEKDMNTARIAMEDAAKTCKASAGHSIKHTEDCIAKRAAYDVALHNWKQSYNFYSENMSSFGKAVQDARLAYENALQAQELAKQEADRKLESLRDTVEQHKATSNLTVDQLTLQNLQRQLTDASVRSPIAGTVTAVYAKEGAIGSGLMFMVEDTQNLVAKTSIREYDIGNITVGMPAVIKSDATQDREFTGTVERIAPAAAKAADGSTQSGNTVEFLTDVVLSGETEGLRVGMTVRLNIILEKKEEVLSVPFDAVITDPEGKSLIYVARANAEGKLTAQPIEVTTGLETDFYVEVIAEGLAEGDSVILTPIGLTPGAEVLQLPQGAAAMMGK